MVLQAGFEIRFSTNANQLAGHRSPLQPDGERMGLARSLAAVPAGVAPLDADPPGITFRNRPKRSRSGTIPMLRQSS